VESGRVRNVLSIAGSDPSGGAGIQADLKTFAALGVYGCAVPAVLTAQNTRGVSRVFALPPDFLEAQLEDVLQDIRIDAVKIGMLGGRAAVQTVSEVLRRHSVPVVVLDPVLRASTGATLLDADAIATLRDELLPLTTLVTPNAAEAGVLLGREATTSVAEAADAARALVRLTLRGALVTGGHVGTGELCSDVLCWDGEITRYDVPRVPHDNHGTGCTLSSAIAAYLALGEPIDSACALAQRFVAAAMSASERLSAGRGKAPLWHSAPWPVSQGLV
jgi:hydroxymethylpyrimidine/phosphomethylpyrimidine kinase